MQQGAGESENAKRRIIKSCPSTIVYKHKTTSTPLLVSNPSCGCSAAHVRGQSTADSGQWHGAYLFQCCGPVGLPRSEVQVECLCADKGHFVALLRRLAFEDVAECEPLNAHRPIIVGAHVSDDQNKYVNRTSLRRGGWGTSGPRLRRLVRSSNSPVYGKYGTYQRLLANSDGCRGHSLYELTEYP